MRSFASAVLWPLFVSTAITVLVVVNVVFADDKVVKDVTESFMAMVAVLTDSRHTSPLPEQRFRIPAPPTRQPTSAVGPRPGELPAHAPTYLTESQSYEFYSEMARLQGHEVWRTTVIGLRGLSPSGDRHSSDDNATPYDDTFIILDPSTRTATELLGATHAGYADSPLSPQGIAQIEPGLYSAYPVGEYLGMAAWHVISERGSGFLPSRRDVNRNGVIDGDEKNTRYWASEILFHNGCGIYYGASRGCQVLPPSRMEEFISKVGASNGFDYVLIDANAVL